MHTRCFIKKNSQFNDDRMTEFRPFADGTRKALKYKIILNIIIL